VVHSIDIGRGKFNYVNMVTTCHFHICRREMCVGPVTGGRPGDSKDLMLASHDSNVIHTGLPSHYLYVLLSTRISALILISVSHLTWQRLHNFTQSLPVITMNSDYTRCAESLMINSQDVSSTEDG